MAVHDATWQQANQRHLTAALAGVRQALERHSQPDGPPAEQPGHSAAELAKAMAAPPALDLLVANFGLSPFERDLLLLCAGVELEASFAALCAAAHGDPQRAYPSFSLALAALPNPHWSALTPQAPLRRWRLIDVGAGASLTLSPLRIDERVLHYLAGVPQLDERLATIAVPMPPAHELVPSQRMLAEQILAAWSRVARGAAAPIIQLCGDDPAGKRAIAATVCAALGLKLSRLPAEALPGSPAEIETLTRLWERESALGGSALLLDCDELDGGEGTRASAASRLIERIGSPMLVTSRERRAGLDRAIITFDVQKPSTDEQRGIWQQALGALAPQLNGQVDQLVAQFNLGAQSIRSAGSSALGRAADPSSPNIGLLVWDACRQQARTRLDDLAQRIESAASWDDLVLPRAQRQILRDMAGHVRQRARVYEHWGFAAKGARGLGISALFAGASGTGKTMAAEVLAHELRLDLYRIDLSSVVSKYIGETEKNLRRIFDAAEQGGAILLFDEADALFGKRSEVKDSHDRHANIEVSYLLQRMEAYRGLAVLTTNMKSALDTAFLRRIRFVVQFPFPDTEQRAEIWRRVFPAATPTEGLSPELLARLNMTGGNIRNIALNAAFLAADAAEPVRMAHLLRAARSEYAKLEKVLTETEIAGWV